MDNDLPKSIAKVFNFFVYEKEKCEEAKYGHTNVGHVWN